MTAFPNQAALVASIQAHQKKQAEADEIERKKKVKAAYDAHYGQMQPAVLRSTDPPAAPQNAVLRHGPGQPAGPQYQNLGGQPAQPGGWGAVLGAYGVKPRTSSPQPAAAPAQPAKPDGWAGALQGLGMKPAGPTQPIPSRSSPAPAAPGPGMPMNPIAAAAARMVAAASQGAVPGAAPAAPARPPAMSMAPTRMGAGPAAMAPAQQGPMGEEDKIAKSLTIIGNRQNYLRQELQRSNLTLQEKSEIQSELRKLGDMERQFKGSQAPGRRALPESGEEIMAKRAADAPGMNRQLADNLRMSGQQMAAANEPLTEYPEDAIRAEAVWQLQQSGRGHLVKNEGILKEEMTRVAPSVIERMVKVREANRQRAGAETQRADAIDGGAGPFKGMSEEEAAQRAEINKNVNARYEASQREKVREAMRQAGMFIEGEEQDQRAQSLSREEQIAQSEANLARARTQAQSGGMTPQERLAAAQADAAIKQIDRDNAAFAGGRPTPASAEAELGARQSSVALALGNEAAWMQNADKLASILSDRVGAGGRVVNFLAPWSNSIAEDSAAITDYETMVLRPLEELASMSPIEAQRRAAPLLSALPMAGGDGNYGTDDVFGPNQRERGEFGARLSAIRRRLMELASAGALASRAPQ